MIQAGFTPGAAHLGTNIEPRGAASEALNVSATARQMYELTLPQPDIAMNERLSQFKRVPPQLQGMNLTHVPTGGFPASQPSIIVGADPAGGVEYNTRLPPLFTLPFTGDKRVTIMPDAPLTGGAPNSELVYREADGKMRNVHGASTVARLDKEAKAAERKRRRYLNGLLQDAGIAKATPQTQHKTISTQQQLQQMSATAPPSAPTYAYDGGDNAAVRDAPAAPCPDKTRQQKLMQYALGASLGVALVIVVVLAIVIGVTSRGRKTR